MDIEILNQDESVITKVLNTDNPDADVKLYGGAGWRNYITPDSERLWWIIDAKRAAIVSESLRRMGGIVPAMGNLVAVDLVVELLQAGAFAGGFPAAGSDMATCRDIYIYARQKIQELSTMTETELTDYEPAADTGWPN
jgi:hypothetical protein